MPFAALESKVAAASEFQKVGHGCVEVDRVAGKRSSALSRSMFTRGAHTILPLRAVLTMAATHDAESDEIFVPTSWIRFAEAAADKVPPGSLQIFMPAHASKCRVFAGIAVSCAT